MRLKWTDDAVADLVEIRAYILENDEQAAQDVATKILTQAESLLSQPAKGRIGRVHNTRESLVPTLPYLLVYRVKKEEVHILRIIHTKRNTFG